MLQKKNFIKNFYKNCDMKTSHVETSHRHLCVQRIKDNLYWKIKFAKQATHVRYVKQNHPNLSKSVCGPPQIPFYRGFFENWKGPGTSLQVKFFDKNFFYYITETGQISLTDYVNFPSHSVKCVFCFMLRHLMASWHLNIWKVKIWLSQERKELSK